MDIFSEINNAALDLQKAHFQNYQRPLQKLASLLNHSELEPYNEKLTDGIDLDQFLEDSHKTGGGMVGSHTLSLPIETDKALGVTLLLIQRFAEQPEFTSHFAHKFFYSGSKIIAGIQALTSQLIIPFLRDYRNYVETPEDMALVLKKAISKKVFIVHGHDVAAREMLARFLESVGLEPIILNEQANQGRTIIEKIEAHSDVGFAVILLTPDDEGRVKGGKLADRARQNVLLELGYFLAQLGRDKICALTKGDLEIPSDFAGVVWEPMDESGGWKQSLGRELEAAGFHVDWNRVMRA